ncbi:amidohydrolase [Desulfobacter hydrogenophilus]|uniref:Amidohydrolase n=1 Tax=Desulfobacter hydrogenophilus TaxID=2291 RepID=A0A328FC88_9BACT|nr:amidohydrolase [Desulfobacter hydrogenophilus]NDY73539.1 amidohydrolase [Desulfobacter hydrogenophilus]QBH14371.1 amidohydrolase [Desulfobacter hydrogenophilus]RAM02304.1 amidohydrolase [Desulfobacter hydrogenophilus]
MKTLFTNIQGISLDEEKPYFSAMVVDGDTIETMGSSDELGAGYAEGSVRVMDLGGKTVLPGFIDTHQHLEWTGKVLGSADLTDCTNFADLFDNIRAQWDKVGKGEWVLAYRVNDQLLQEKRMPRAAELDVVCPDAPVAVIHTSLHFLTLNTMAIKALGVTGQMEGVDTENGRMTGVVRDPASLTIVMPQIDRMIPKASVVNGYDMAARMALKNGITSLHCLEGKDGDPECSAFFHKHHQNLPLHTVHWNQNRDVQSSLDLGLPRIGGCIFADGAIDCYTAALFEPYSNQPDNYGTLTFTQAQMDEFILEAHANGLQIAVHCEAEAAIEQVLHAMEKALAKFPRTDHRHRIEHLEVPTYTQIERMAKAGIIAAMQPAFFPYLMQDQNFFEQMLGPSRHKRLHPYRTILDAGVVICGGSDSPVTPYNPLAGIQAAVCHPFAPERVTLTEALKMFTTAAAYSVFEEHDRGRLKPGMKAEFIVLDRNPYQVAPQDICKINIKQVFAKGKFYNTANL